MTAQSQLSVPRNRVPKYAVLLLVLCLLIAFTPTATATGSAVLVEMLFDAVIIVGAYSVTRSGVPRWPFLALTVLTFIARWCALLWGGLELEILLLGRSRQRRPTATASSNLLEQRVRCRGVPVCQVMGNQHLIQDGMHIRMSQNCSDG